MDAEYWTVNMMVLCAWVMLFNVLLGGVLVWIMKSLSKYREQRRLFKEGVRARAKVTGIVSQSPAKYSDPDLLDDTLLQNYTDDADGMRLVKCAYAALGADNEPISLEGGAEVGAFQYLIWRPLLKVGQEVDIHYLKDDPEVFCLDIHRQSFQGDEMIALTVAFPLLWGLFAFFILLSGMFPLELMDSEGLGALLLKHFIILFFMAFMGIMLYSNVVSAIDFIQKMELWWWGIKTEGRITRKWTVRSGKHTHYHIEYTHPEIEPFRKNISVNLKFYQKIGNGKVRVHYGAGEAIRSDLIGNPHHLHHFLLFTGINLMAIFVLVALFYSTFEELFG